MTDNEKRAHDLAIAVCTDVCHLKRQSQVDVRTILEAFSFFFFLLIKFAPFYSGNFGSRNL
jgi:hypothetical protein